jgi:hypothetical protein
MNKIRIKKKRIKVKSRNIKKRLMKIIKILMKRSKNLKVVCNNEEYSDLPEIMQPDLGMTHYDIINHRFSGVHPEFYALNEYEWMGLMTLKFYSYSHSKEKHESQDNRLIYVEEFMNNIRIKLGISDREFIWCACEEFGFTEIGHIHIIFSFDYLQEKNRMDKIQINDFSDNGEFSKQAKESVSFVTKKLKMKPESINFHWTRIDRTTMWDNKKVVSYFCKKETNRGDKYFVYSKFFKKIKSKEQYDLIK